MGVDYALLDGDGRLIENPVHHRDRRTDGAMEALFARVPAREIYERTGIQLMPINTLVQLYAAVAAGERSLEIAETLLLIPTSSTSGSRAAPRPSTRMRRPPSSSTRVRRRGRLSCSNDLGCLPKSFQSSSARQRL